MRATMLLTGRVVLASATLLALATGPVRAQDGAGELRCNIQGGFGLIIASNRAVSCSYRRSGLPTEFYSGQTGNIGVDIGPTNAKVVTYKVVTSDPAAPAALQGDFAGPGFAAAGGAGIAANALVGGNGVTLLPIPNTATTASTGLNLSAGINQLHLQFAAFEQVPEHRRVGRRAPRSIDLQ